MDVENDLGQKTEKVRLLSERLEKRVEEVGKVRREMETLRDEMEDVRKERDEAEERATRCKAELDNERERLNQNIERLQQRNWEMEKNMVKKEMDAKHTEEMLDWRLDLTERVAKDSKEELKRVKDELDEMKKKYEAEVVLRKGFQEKAELLDANMIPGLWDLAFALGNITKRPSPKRKLDESGVASSSLS
jgi:chromosome segregation ATPase